jgi:mannosylglycoprotein endo-beta-mannosidase
VKMIRNHPSLAFWCGGNEITPTDDILLPMKDSILPALDGTRYLFDYSNSDSMSFNSLGGNGDGPYGVQPLRTFWAERTFPFNSEVGSVGVGDYESLERFMPADHLTAPQYPGKEDPVWAYHKYIGYDSTVYAYGPVKDLKDFTLKAQLVNYDQYRALMEGYSSHMWEWYTGSIIWKTQNPWTALRGQMYDYYLDVNACLYGLHSGSEPLHVMFNPVENMVEIVNNTVSFHRNMMLEVKAYDRQGKDKLLTQVYEEIGPSAVRKYVGIGKQIDKLRKEEGVFLSLRLLDGNRQPISENFYWLPDAAGQYSGLQHMATADLKVEAKQAGTGKIAVTLTNAAGNPVAFFNRVALIDPTTRKRILPAFYSDNYLSVVPGASRTVIVEYRPLAQSPAPVVSVKGWNVEETSVPVK